MKTICVAAQKGGAGKTTVSRNLAVAAVQDGQRVLCVDLDPQQSLRHWWEGRDGDAPMMLATDPQPRTLADTLAAAADHFDLVVIDTPPAAPSWLSEVMKAADLVLIPVRPSPDDLRAVGATIAALRSSSTPFAFIMSQTPRAKLTEEAARVLAQHGRVAPVNIAQRVIYAETGATGQGVTETDDTRAAQETTALWAYVKGLNPMKKGLDLGGMIDPASTPKETGIPQRGANSPRAKLERRSDQMSIRMKPSTRERIEALAEAEGVPIAEIVERAIAAYKGHA